MINCRSERLIHLPFGRAVVVPQHVECGVSFRTLIAALKATRGQAAHRSSAITAWSEDWLGAQCISLGPTSDQQKITGIEVAEIAQQRDIVEFRDHHRIAGRARIGIVVNRTVAEIGIVERSVRIAVGVCGWEVTASMTAAPKGWVRYCSLTLPQCRPLFSHGIFVQNSSGIWICWWRRYAASGQPPSTEGLTHHCDI